MKTTYLKILASFALALVATTSSAATSISLSPITVNVKEGQQFTITVSVNPQGTANYAEKIELKYPADILAVTSFNLAGNWIALTQTGYDVTDNANGVLLKTAGYPSGVSSATTFGTVSFTAKKTGTANITVGSNSRAFESSGEVSVVGGTTSVTVGSATTPTQTVVTPVASASSVKKVQPPVVVAVADTQLDQQVAPQTAAVVDSVSTSRAPLLWIFIASIVIVALGGFFLYKRYTTPKVSP